MKLFLACFAVAGCAQPSATSDGGGGGLHRDGGGLQFEQDGGSQFGPPSDLSGHDLTPASADLAQLHDLAIPAGADLAGVDLAPPPDLAHVVTNVENCFNDVDDDGNGKINDGCPDTITVGADAPLMPFGGGGGSVGTPTHCPANQVAIGLRLYFDDNVLEMSGVAVACSPVTLVRGASSYSITLAMPVAAEAPLVGSTVTFQEDYPCTANQPVVTALMDTSTYVDGLGLSCGLPTLSLGADNKLTITLPDQNTNLGYDYGGGTQHTQTCPAGQALVGYKGRVGSYMDQAQPVCAPLVVNYKN